MARDISDNLAVPRIGFAQPPEGIVKVIFHADASGRVDHVGIAEPSTSSVLDRAAIAAIERMKTVRPAPASMNDSRSIEAWVYFANTDGAAERFGARLRRMAHTGVASSEQGALIVAGARG